MDLWLTTPIMFSFWTVKIQSSLLVFFSRFTTLLDWDVLKSNVCNENDPSSMVQIFKKHTWRSLAWENSCRPIQKRFILNTISLDAPGIDSSDIKHVYKYNWYHYKTRRPLMSEWTILSDIFWWALIGGVPVASQISSWTSWLILSAYLTNTWTYFNWLSKLHDSIVLNSSLFRLWLIDTWY
jgi:hypothetical protein